MSSTSTHGSTITNLLHHRLYQLHKLAINAFTKVNYFSHFSLQFKCFDCRILPNIEDVTVPLSSKNLSSITSKSICLKIEQTGDRFAGGGSWFIDDFFMIRSRDSDHVFYDSFETMRPAKWQRLAGGHWKVS